MKHGLFVETYPEPSWSVLRSIPVNVLTGMILVDAAAHGYTTPTLWANEVADRLPARVKESLENVRALLIHGMILRDYFLQQFHEESPLHKDWRLFRHWIADMTDEQVDALINRGIYEGISYYRTHLAPIPEVDSVLSEIGGCNFDAMDLSDSKTRFCAARAVVVSFNQSPDDVLHTIAEPKKFKEAIVDCLDRIWEEVSNQHNFTDALDAEVKRLERDIPSQLHPDDLIRKVSTSIISLETSAQIRKASRIVFAPCLNLGSQLSIANLDGTTLVIMYEPKGAVTEIEVPQHAVSIHDVNLTSIVVGFGDRVRLQILMLLAEYEELFAQQICDRLGVHQSTISRNLAQLEQNDLVQVRREGNAKYFRLNRSRLTELSRELLRIFDSE